LRQGVPEWNDRFPSVEEMPNKRLQIKGKKALGKDPRTCGPEWEWNKIRGLRRIEWVIFGLKTRETWGLRGDFAFYGIWNLSMTDGWHEHRNVDGGFGIHIRFLVFDLNRQCAAFLVTRKRA
jgi:hypothetical protein